MSEEEKELREEIIIQQKEIEELKNILFVRGEIIDKQEKEIEELKRLTREYESYKCGEGNKIVIASKEYFIKGYFKDFLNDYVSKDKIKEKIKDYKSYRNLEMFEKYNYREIINVLKELLEE